MGGKLEGCQKTGGVLLYDTTGGDGYWAHTKVLQERFIYDDVMCLSFVYAISTVLKFVLVRTEGSTFMYVVEPKNTYAV